MASATYYTVNPFSPTKDIIDVSVVEDEFAPFTSMGLPIRIPEGVSIHGKPKTLSELLAAKAAGILRAYGGYTSIVMSPCLSVVGGVVGSVAAPGVNTAQSYNYIPGNGNTNHLVLGDPTEENGNGYPGFLSFQSVGLGRAPENCVVLWEVYSTGYSDPTGQTFRQYFQQASDAMVAEISFDGKPSTIVGSGSVSNIGASQQGLNMVLSLNNQTNVSLYVGSWAIVY